MKFKPLKIQKARPVPENWRGQIMQQGRRVTGITPKGLRMFGEQPARWVPRATGLLKHLATGKASQKGISAA